MVVSIDYGLLSLLQSDPLYRQAWVGMQTFLNVIISVQTRDHVLNQSVQSLWLQTQAVQEVTSKEEEIAVREHAELSATIAALQQDVDNLSQQRVQVACLARSFDFYPSLYRGCRFANKHHCPDMLS